MAKEKKQIYINESYQKYWLQADGPEKIDHNRSYVTVTSSRADGGANPGWRKKIRRRESATTTLSGDKYTVSRKPMIAEWILDHKQTYTDWKERPNYFRGHNTSLLVTQTLPLPSLPIFIANAAANKAFFKKVKELRSSFDGLVWLGELRETLRMLRNPARSLFNAAGADYLRKVNRLKKANPRNWRDGLAGAWLESSFGWTPFISDIGGAVDTLERLQGDPIAYHIIRKTSREQPQPVVYEGVDSNVACGAKMKSIITEGQKVLVRFKGLYTREPSVPVSLASGRLGALAEAANISFSSFVPAVWELLPWSFLVDYFSNIGEVLEQSFASLDGVRWVNCTEIVTAYRTGVLMFDEAATRASYTNTFYGPVFKRTNYSIPGVVHQERQLWARSARSPTVAPLTFELPGRPQQWLNIAALWSAANSISPQKFDFARFSRRG